jgi:membrane dipeptidase
MAHPEGASMRRSILCSALILAAGPLLGPTGAQQPAAADDALIAKARAIHERVITLDTHVDISVSNFTKDQNYTQDLRNQVTLPKMMKGGLDAAFFIVYVGQGRGADNMTRAGYDSVYKQASEKFDAIHRLTKEIAPDKIELALTSADVRRIDKAGKKVALIGVENGYSLGDETTAIARVKEFHDRGARYLSLAHNGHSQLADSNTGEANNEWLHKGLSPLGKQVVAELNRVGIMVDISHPSKEANMQAMALSRAPVIASHSGARAVQDHSRNLDDEQLLALKKNGGVAQAVALAAYVKVHPASAERTAALEKLAAEFSVPVNALGRGGRGRAGGPPAGGPPVGAPPATAGGRAGAGAGGGGRGGDPLANLSEQQRADLQKRLDDINAKYPAPPRANVKDFVDHIDYIAKKIGVDHVGISSDFDGGGGIDGWSDASETFNVTLELVRRGYTEEQIGKIWSGNLLRVMDQVQKVARDLQKK